MSDNVSSQNRSATPVLDSGLIASRLDREAYERWLAQKWLASDLEEDGYPSSRKAQTIYQDWWMAHYRRVYIQMACLRHAKGWTRENATEYADENAYHAYCACAQVSPALAAIEDVFHDEETALHDNF